MIKALVDQKVFVCISFGMHFLDFGEKTWWALNQLCILMLIIMLSFDKLENG